MQLYWLECLSVLWDVSDSPSKLMGHSWAAGYGALSLIIPVVCSFSFVFDVQVFMFLGVFLVLFSLYFMSFVGFGGNWCFWSWSSFMAWVFSLLPPMKWHVRILHTTAASATNSFSRGGYMCVCFGTSIPVSMIIPCWGSTQASEEKKRTMDLHLHDQMPWVEAMTVLHSSWNRRFCMVLNKAGK